MAYSVFVSATGGSRGGHAVRNKVEREAAVRVNGRFPARRGAQLHRHARQQFARIERLGDIIRRAVAQEVHLVAHICFRADDDNRNPLDFRQQPLAGKAGQHQIEQNEIGALRAEQKQRLRSRIGAPDGVAFPAEHLLEEVADLNVVVDDKNVFRHLSSRSAQARGRPCARRRAKIPPLPAALRFPQSRGRTARFRAYSCSGSRPSRFRSSRPRGAA